MLMNTQYGEQTGGKRCHGLLGCSSLNTFSEGFLFAVPDESGTTRQIYFFEHLNLGAHLRWSMKGIIFGISVFDRYLFLDVVEISCGGILCVLF